MPCDVVCCSMLQCVAVCCSGVVKPCCETRHRTLSIRHRTLSTRHRTLARARVLSLSLASCPTSTQISILGRVWHNTRRLGYHQRTRDTV